jgi:hypothetical protein
MNEESGVSIQKHNCNFFTSKRLSDKTVFVRLPIGQLKISNEQIKKPEPFSPGIEFEQDTLYFKNNIFFTGKYSLAPCSEQNRSLLLHSCSFSESDLTISISILHFLFHRAQILGH